MGARPSCPQPGHVQVWYAHTDDLGPVDTRAGLVRAWLQPFERDRHERFRRDSDRDMFLLGRIMARRLVGDALGVPPTAWRWRDGPRGRPDVDLPDCPVSFNLAHSGDLVACALAAGIAVGVDVEDRRRPRLDHQLVRRYCSAGEQAAIDAAGPEGWRDRFLRHWTLKEAYLKARGLGIAVPLADLAFTIDDDRVTAAFTGTLAGADPDWAFAFVDVGPRHFVAVAGEAPGGRRPRFTSHALPASVLTTPA